MSKALNEGLRRALEDDPKVLIMGEDVGRLGGVFRVTDGLQKDFGEQRVFNTPLAESGIVGTAVGLALRGYRPVCEIQFDGFVYPAYDQIVSQVAKIHYRSHGRVRLPIVIRIPYGGGIGAVEHHSESPEAYFVHTPGLKVVTCSNPVDAYWMIPHFEKMLYDNALLLPVYAQAAVATGDSFYARIANRTADWALREMLAPEGGFYSSLDADSEGHEGRFYVWDREEIRQALSDEEYTVFAPRFGLDREPNFEGRWHLHAFRSLESIAEETGRSVEQIESLIDAARAKLFQLRERRVRPGRDEKILTSWNALMIRGLAIAARSLARDELAEAATRALEFIRRTLWRDGRLRATYRDGRARLNAYLDDYVFLADAILELQQVRFRADELAFACELIEAVRKHFADERSGGFYFTSDDHEALIHRSKALGDDATPSGNGVAAQVLLRMGWLLGRSDWLQDAERTLRAVPGVLDVEALRLRWVGHRVRAEAGIVVDPGLSVVEAHAIASEAHHQLLHHVPKLVDALVHTSPAGPEGAAHHDALAHHRR